MIELSEDDIRRINDTIQFHALSTVRRFHFNNHYHGSYFEDIKQYLWVNILKVLNSKHYDPAKGHIVAYTIQWIPHWTRQFFSKEKWIPWHKNGERFSTFSLSYAKIKDRRGQRTLGLEKRLCVPPNQIKIEGYRNCKDCDKPFKGYGRQKFCDKKCKSHYEYRMRGQK